MMRSPKRRMARSSRALVQITFSLLLALAAPISGAELYVDTEPDPNPLRPADTSSPRDTLRSFLENANEAVDAWRRDELDAKSTRAYLRAMETLDLGSTPHSDTWWIRTERLLLLKELLDRIELPPESAIPGDSEVADGAVLQWTIPDTRITIARIGEGPRAGEFLFSAGTVEKLHRYYAHARHLPYKPGIQAGYYEDWVRSERTDRAREQRIRNRLKPVDTSSPRSTLAGFLDSINRAYALVIEADAALTATPPTMTMQEAREVDIAAAKLLRRAVHTLDLSQVPEVLRDDIGSETALQLKEILDRMRLPPVDSVPDARMIAVAREQADGPIRWRYPNTEIEIVELTEGAQQGQFLFSADTVAHTGDFYGQIREHAYRSGTSPTEWKSPARSEGFYEYYISTAGYMVPRINVLGRFVEELPAWMKTVHGGQTLWQWVAMLLCVLAFILFAWAIHRLIRRTAQGLHSPLDHWLTILTPIVIATVAGLLAGFINNDINVTGHLRKAVVTGGSVIVIAMVAWAVFLLCKAIAETVVDRPRMREKSSEVALLRIGARVLGFLLGAWIVIGGIRALGADLIPLLAGLGVGGLALALAAQSTIANFIGGLILYVNKPVRVGEFCRYGEDPNPGWLRIGTVEEIGLLSTRLRGIDRTVTTIPNAEFSRMHIVNLTKRDQRLLMTTLQLRYETTPDQLRYILTRLRELLLGHPMVTPDPARVRFVGFSVYSLDVEIFAYLRCVEQDTFLAVQEDLFLRMADIVSEAGSGFAFPSQTAYLARDAGLDDERAATAESRVGQQRATGKLPFPEFEEEERERLEDILDYPPKGSHDYQPRPGTSDT
jgi:MscS family membrane protein